jgi:hypothetical protein
LNGMTLGVQSVTCVKYMYSKVVCACHEGTRGNSIVNVILDLGR